MSIVKQLPLLLIICSVLVTSGFAKPKDDLKAFPQAEEGYERFVFPLPPLDDESSAKVSLVIGKMMKADSAKQYGLSGSINKVSIHGWGYTYYQVESNGQMFAALIAPHKEASKVDRFVEIRDDIGPHRYNSKVPVVAIVPKGFEVKYRVLTSGVVQSASVVL
ncbi:ecotin family protein [Puniceicoccaceae bacterium]|nr:ecotin family protein [Puniceicoccaceae bacterium]MDC0497422.1 ecotin family protein [bacterium]